MNAQESTFGKIGGMVKKAAAGRKAAKDELARQQAQGAEAAGHLMTSGVYGTSTVEVYENGFVRVASWSENATPNGPKKIDKNTPYERLRSIRFSAPRQESDTSGSASDGLNSTVSGLLKGGKALAKASAVGMAASAASSYLGASASAKSYLTITTDRQIHNLTNQVPNSVGLKMSNAGHNGVGEALEAAGNQAIGVDSPATSPTKAASSQGAPTSAPIPAERQMTQGSEKPMADRLRELATLHGEGILSDEEFASAKSKLLGGL